MSNNLLDVMRGGEILKIHRSELAVGDSTPFVEGYIYEVIPCDNRDLLDADLRVVRLGDDDPRWGLFSRSMEEP
jgi:hypothetical protein